MKDIYQPGNLVVHRCYQGPGAGLSGIVTRVLGTADIELLQQDAAKFLSSPFPTLHGLALAYTRLREDCVAYQVAWHRRGIERLGLNWIDASFITDCEAISLAAWQDATPSMREADQLAARLWRRWRDCPRHNPGHSRSEALWSLYQRADRRYWRRAGITPPIVETSTP